MVFESVVLNTLAGLLPRLKTPIRSASRGAASVEHLQHAQGAEAQPLPHDQDRDDRRLHLPRAERGSCGRQHASARSRCRKPSRLLGELHATASPSCRLVSAWSPRPLCAPRLTRARACLCGLRRARATSRVCSADARRRGSSACETRASRSSSIECADATVRTREPCTLERIAAWTDATSMLYERMAEASRTLASVCVETRETVLWHVRSCTVLLFQ